MIRLSFIVPFYNVEPYIEECIHSLYAQDIPREEYEVICVDDCSPDGSRAIVERLQLEYPTLRLLCHSENKRQGGARNTGMHVARGQYIWFVDSDDFIIPNCLRSLLAIAEKEDLDILDFDFDADFSKLSFVKNLDSYEMGPCSAVDYVFSEHRGGWSWRCCSVCWGIIKRELLNGMLFRERVQYEDNDFAIELYAHAARLHHIPMKPYFYRVVDDSTVHKQVTISQVLYNILLIQSFISLYYELKVIDDRWGNGVWELIKYVSRTVVEKLCLLSKQELNAFYRGRMGNVNMLSSFVGKKVWLSLRFKWALFCFFKR